jgi:hypothetical protein
MICPPFGLHDRPREVDLLVRFPAGDDFGLWMSPLQKIENTLLSHDSALREVIQKLRPLLLPPPDPPKPRIGVSFQRSEALR